MAGERDKPDQKDDLFEDLDKFFAPIQDVDWPESRPEAPPPPAGPPPKEEPEPPSGAPESHPPEPPRPEPPRPEPPREEWTPDIDDIPTPEETITVPEVAAGEGGDEGPEAAEIPGQSSLEGEAEMSIDDLRTPPPQYRDLPGPGGGELEPGEAESVEEAAEHFAESIRLEGEEPAPEGEEPAPEAVERELLADLEETRAEPSVSVDDTTGPSWQDPGSVDIGGERDMAEQRNVPAAMLSGVILAAVAIGALAIRESAFAFVAGAIVLLAQGELYGVMAKRHLQPATALGLVAGAMILWAAYARGEGAMIAVLALSVAGAFLWYMAAPPAHRKNATTNIGMTVLGIIYVPFLAGFAFVTLSAPGIGRELVIAVLGLTFAYDISAFVVGYFWGTADRALAPAISPNKTWQGAIGGTLIVVLLSVSLIASTVEPLADVGRAVGLALVIVVFAPLGDLAESLLKRDLGVKDMSSVLPGHGGVLDRIDAVLFTAPAAYLFLQAAL